MDDHIKIIVFSILIIMCLSLMAGCKERQSQSKKIAPSKTTHQEIKDAEAIYTNKLKDIITTDQIVIDDDSPCQTMWSPQKQETTLSKVTSWLQQANLYKGEIPKPKNAGKDEAVYNAYSGPPILNISSSNNHKITIKPAYYIDKDDRNFYSTHYITNVLEFDYDGQKTYIQSNLLYNWLKNDNWKTEFKQF